MTTISLKSNKDLFLEHSNNKSNPHGVTPEQIGAAKAVSSTTQPSTGLYDGLLWYNPTLQETKMYANGSFQDISGKIRGTLNLSGTADASHRLVIPVGVDKYAT